MWQQIVPQSTGGIYSLGSGVALIVLGILSYLKVLAIPDSDASNFIWGGVALITSHQVRRTVEGAKVVQNGSNPGDV